METTIESWMSLKGRDIGDGKVVSAFATEALMEAEKRAAVVDDIANLGSIVDGKRLSECADAIAGIAQLEAAALQMAQRFDTSPIGQPLPKFADKITKIKERSVKQYETLCSYFP